MEEMYRAMFGKRRGPWSFHPYFQCATLPTPLGVYQPGSSPNPILFGF